MTHRYEIIISWSEVDGVFVADVPELPGCMAHGKTHQAALKSANEAITLWIDTAREFDRAIPAPKGRRLMLAQRRPISKQGPRTS
ncbi:MAG: type II toxin-antitoxin system HicB family antitoxin [Candidatus Hydrogenedentes bacterium]|nr:type II toxin-antitoxin system HicB family antitoxin [Candidatus Hydrogenedentota bacterium]